MQSIMTQFDAFGIPTAIPDYVLDSYRSPRHRENSSFFPSQSSHTSISIDERNIKISKFRRSMFAEGSPDFVHAYTITSINNEMNDLFEDIVCRQLFSNDSERMRDFITLLVTPLEALKTILYDYVSLPSSFRQERLAHFRSLPKEEVYLQLIFQMFMNHILENLPHDPTAQTSEEDRLEDIPVNTFVLEKTLSDGRLLKGYSDVGIKRRGDSEWAENFLSLIELKNPFSSLYRTSGSKAKEQLIGEMVAFGAMREESELATSMGGLTDIFTICVAFNICGKIYLLSRMDGLLSSASLKHSCIC